MERSQKRPAYYPLRCPGCGDVVNLLVGNSTAVIVHVHNAPGCSRTLYYRCWLERGLPLPRVEFFAHANAMEMTLQPHGGSRPDDPQSAPPPSPQLDAPTGTGASATRDDTRSPRRATPTRARAR